MSFHKSMLNINSDDENIKSNKKNTIKKNFDKRIASGDEDEGNLNVIRKKFNKKRNSVGIIVVDLDDTLIDETNREFDGADHFIGTLSKKYKLVLWTAGNAVHAKMFIEQFSQANKFTKVLYGLYNKTKSVSLIRRQLPITTGPYILIDDSVHNLHTGGYDITIDVKKYNYIPATKKFSKMKFINYKALLEDLEELVDVWYNSIC